MTGLWRWRRNALCRRSDLLEAWVALAAALIIAVGSPVVGLLAGFSTLDAMERSVREQHHQRSLRTATVIRVLPHPPVDPDPETSSSRDAHRRVVAGWTAPDGALRTGVMSTSRTGSPGHHFRIWTDAQGRVVDRPLDETTAASHAALAGTGAGAAALALVEGARRLFVWRILQRRYEQWDRAWQAAGQDWGRAGTGS